MIDWSWAHPRCCGRRGRCGCAHRRCSSEAHAWHCLLLSCSSAPLSRSGRPLRCWAAGQRASGGHGVVATDENRALAPDSVGVDRAGRPPRHPPPIDYQRRRHLDYTGLLPETAWSRICRRSVPAPRAHRPRVGICASASVPAPPSPTRCRQTRQRPAASLALFPTRLTPELKAALDEYALTFLAEQGISDEPVHWQPPTGCWTACDCRCRHHQRGRARCTG